MHGLPGARVERVGFVVGSQHGVFHIIVAPKRGREKKRTQAALWEQNKLVDPCRSPTSLLLYFKEPQLVPLSLLFVDLGVSIVRQFILYR